MSHARRCLRLLAVGVIVLPAVPAIALSSVRTRPRPLVSVTGWNVMPAVISTTS